MTDPTPETAQPLTIPPETVCYIIVKAHEFDAKVEPVDPDSGSNPADDGAAVILQDFRDDPTAAELAAAIGALNTDESAELVALSWLGRGDFTAGEWPAALDLARQRRSDHTAAYLMGQPQLGDFLEEGLSRLGYDCDDEEIGHL
ncbi:DUF3775 domain-containing protein [Ferrovibrio xuzhouensis]|uniref:DUF3775 domain-containing protein n=1 Tax=Ferrovibrio xuzhouensis TaxID=1576914 RepID=A0ABV7VBE4_9PROT